MAAESETPVPSKKFLALDIGFAAYGRHIQKLDFAAPKEAVIG